MKKLSIEDKANIYFRRYRTGGSFAVKEYLKIMNEVKTNNALKAKIEEIRKMYI